MLPTPVFWPGEFHGLYSPWGCKELDVNGCLSIWGFPDSSVGKEPTCHAGDPGSTPGVRKIHWRRDTLHTPVFLGFPCDSAGKESACNVGDLVLIPGLGRSPGEGKGSLSLLEWPSILAWRIQSVGQNL